MSKAGEPNKKKKEEEDTMTEEDKQKKLDIEMMVERAADPEEGVQKAAIEALRNEIRNVDTSISSIPKGIKFLRPHYARLTEIWATTQDDNSARLADVLSVLAMTNPTEAQQHDSLKYRLKGTAEDLASWGHEYVRNLSGEIVEEWAQRKEEQKPVEELLRLVEQIVPFNMSHHAEPEACDLLLELEMLPRVLEFVDENNCDRICLYLTNNATYVPEPEDSEILQVVLDAYLKQQRLPEALCIALRLDRPEQVQAVYEQCQDPVVKKQLAFMLGRQQAFSFEEEDESLVELIGNVNLCKYFERLATDLDVLEPKAPRDIYKTHLIDNRHAIHLQQEQNSAKQNLAASFVDAFVNAGHGKDALLTNDEEKAWIWSKNKDHAKTSATAALGLVHLWSEDAVNQLDQFFYVDEAEVRAGAMLGLGVASSGLRNENDLAFTLLAEYVDASSDTPTQARVGACLGLGIAYAGSARLDLYELLSPIVEDDASSMELAAIAAFSIGLIFVGSANPDAAQLITETLMQKSEADLASAYSRFFALTLGLLFLGKQSDADLTLEMLKVLPEPFASYAQVTLDSCAYAGTGNVLKIQQMLQVCGQHPTDDAKKALQEQQQQQQEELEQQQQQQQNPQNTRGGLLGAAANAANNNNNINGNNVEEPKLTMPHQPVAVLGIAMIAMSEEIGEEMAIRALDLLLQYGDPVVRRAVPLALGMLSLSNPRMTVMDTLSKLSHDTDLDVAQGAIMALGMIGAGTNNSRIAQLLRNLSAYYCKDPDHLFMVRIAQGLLHLGKGLMSLEPYHCHRNLFSKVSFAGLFGVMHACLDLPNIIHQHGHYLLYLFTCCMHPRMLMTFNEDLEPIKVSVRVGQAVDTVGQAGKPKTITGFQTHQTPVLIAHGERAELATDDYLATTSFLEHCVILKKNPNAQ